VLFFVFLAFFAGFAGVAAALAGASSAFIIGAVDFGMSAAIAVAARPTVIKAEAISGPNLIMGSPEW
jgi:hypothetical protein